MKAPSKTLLRGVALLLLLGICKPLSANPVGDFFKRVGRTISKPPAKTQPMRRTTSKGTAKRTPTAAASPAASVAPSAEPTATEAPAPPPPPQPASQPQPSATLAQVSERRATTDTPSDGGAHRDLPYGVPVPGRAGFVTSPFAPTRGFVDVRGFPPGTEVKDPYSGKVFLTP